jgi:hypothetical protein
LAAPKEIVDLMELFESDGKSYSKEFLEKRIKNWPSDWGDDLHILIYGDFNPPSEDICIPELGITVNHAKKENTGIKSARCVLEASVTIEDKSLESLIDAIRRINTLLGVWTLFKLGQEAIGWTSYITRTTSGGVPHKLEEDKNLDPIIRNILNLPVKVRKKVDAALYWMREPRNLIVDSYRSDLLRIYSAYWNAFECLVDAAHKIKPEPKLENSEKELQINKIFDAIKAQDRKLTINDIIECSKIVDPGFKAKASHALTVCFPSDVAQHLVNECFEIPEKPNRLYQIRNDIDHGNIDAENLEELYRVEPRLTLLEIIVRRMFRQIIRLSLSMQEAQKCPTSK